MVEYAGLGDCVKIEIGSLSERLEKIQRKYGFTQLDTLMMDHGTAHYLPDLRLLEDSGMMKQDTSVLCDWTLYPGSDTDEKAPLRHEEFVSYLETSGRSATARQTLHNKEVFSVSTWSGFPV